jgi:anti-sigma factor RsiW
VNCQEIESLTADYLGGELDEGQRERFASHLSACSACRTRIHEFEETLSELNRLLTVPPVETVESKLNATVRRPDSAQPNSTQPNSTQPNSTQPSMLRRLVIASMKAAAILILGVLIGRASVGDSRSPATNDAPRVRGVEMAQVSPEPRLHPKWIEAGRDVRSGRSSLASHLLILAHAAQP